MARSMALRMQMRYKKEKKEHPSLPKKTVKKIVSDHEHKPMASISQALAQKGK